MPARTLGKGSSTRPGESTIDSYLEKLAKMTPEVKENTVKSLVMATKKWRWTPTAGPQFHACFCEADELFYGGQAGGGK